METKVCTKCGIEKELSVDFFMKAKTNKDGFSGRCRQCTLEYKKQYYKDNTENSKQYYKDNFEHIAKHKKHYQEDNLEKIIEYQKQYHIDNKEKNIKKSKQYAKDNAEKIAEHKSQYYRDNREKTIAYCLQYAKDNPEKYRLRSQQRKALKKLLPCTFTLEQWKSVKKYFNSNCCYCGKELPLQQEHFIPVTSGGAYSESNIIPACKTCNCSKHDKLFEDWYPKYRYYSKKREKIILEYLESVKEEEELALTI